jgi:hypothetical protein
VLTKRRVCGLSLYDETERAPEMDQLTKLVLIVGLLAAAIAPARATASSTYSDTLRGYEYWASSTDGKFAGTASGALRGSWSTDVQHTALCLGCSTTAGINGGSFSLSTLIHYVPTVVRGRFTGGTVQVVNRGANCSKQTFAVNGILSDVGTWRPGSGSGTFVATLTHYRRYLFGSCVTYGASVAGNVAVSL